MQVSEKDVSEREVGVTKHKDAQMRLKPLQSKGASLDKNQAETATKQISNAIVLNCICKKLISQTKKEKICNLFINLYVYVNSYP